MGWSEKYKKSIDCDNPKGFSQRAHCQGKQKKMQEGNLHHWFKGSKSKDGKPGWVQSDGSPCANEPGETKTPKCYSSARLAALKRKGKKGENLIKSADRRKRQQDPGQQSKSGAAKPTNVKTFAKGKKNKHYVKPEPGLKETMEMQEGKDIKGKGSGKKDACYHKVKASAKVWPSAYASGRLVQCRKVGADNWGNKSEEWVAQTAAEYLFNEGLNEDGVAIFIEELGLDQFIDFIYDIGEEVLAEAKFDRLPPVSKSGKMIKDLPKGGARSSAIKSKRKTREVLRQKVDSESKSKPGFASFSKKASEVSSQSKKDNASKAVASAKKQQPKKKGILDRVAGEVLKGMERHKAAMTAARETGKTISKAAKVGAKGAQEFGKGFKSGVETAGKVAKVAKKVISDDYKFSDWRDDFNAMEYEFIDIIKPEPLVTEASFEINPQKHRDEVRAKKIRDRTKTGDEGSEIAKKKVKGPKLMGEDKYSDLSKHTSRMSLLNNPGPRSTPEQTAEKKARLEKKRGMKLDDHPQFKEEVDERRAPAELVARLSARREGEMAQDGPNKPAYYAKQRILAKTKAKRMKEEVESIDELKCWKGYKRKKGAIPGEKGSCVKENEEVIEAKDETEIGITGLPIPKKKRSPKKQYEFEKKRRENLGRNVGGKTYSDDVAPYKTNPRIGYLRNEEMENELGEARHTPTKSDLESKIGGGNLKKLVKKASTRIDYDVDGDVDPQDKVEKKTGEYGEELPTPFGKFRTGSSKTVKTKKENFSNWRQDLDEDWQKVNKSDKTDGMSQKAVDTYRRENPGSKLKTAVTGDPKPGSKDAKRRKSFCARSKGQQDMHNIDCSKDPDKAICKARRRWKC